MTSCKNIFGEFEILNVPSLIILECTLSVKRTSAIDDLVVKKKTAMEIGKKSNKFKVAVIHTGRHRSSVCFNRNLYNALPEEILNCDEYIDFKRQLNKSSKDEVIYNLDEFLNNAL